MARPSIFLKGFQPVLSTSIFLELGTVGGGAGGGSEGKVCLSGEPVESVKEHGFGRPGRVSGFQPSYSAVEPGEEDMLMTQ